MMLTDSLGTHRECAIPAACEGIMQVVAGHPGPPPLDAPGHIRVPEGLTRQNRRGSM
jgi:hypothetical protein